MARPWYERGTPILIGELAGTVNQCSVSTGETSQTITLSTGLTLPGTLTVNDTATFTGVLSVTAAVTLSTALTISGLGSTDPAILGRCWRTTDGLLHVSSGST